MGAAPLILGIAGLGLQAYGMYQSAKAQEAQTEANIKANMREAELLEDQASQVGEQGVMAEYDIIQQGEQYIGQQRASASGSGIVIDTGTNADLLAESQMAITADVTTSRETYAKERKRLLEAAEYTRANAASIAQQGQYRTTAAYLTGAGSLLGTGATLANRWYNYQSTGAY